MVREAREECEGDEARGKRMVEENGRGGEVGRGMKCSSFGEWRGRGGGQGRDSQHEAPRGLTHKHEPLSSSLSRRVFKKCRRSRMGAGW